VNVAAHSCSHQFIFQHSSRYISVDHSAVLPGTLAVTLCCKSPPTPTPGVCWRPNLCVLVLKLILVQQADDVAAAGVVAQFLQESGCTRQPNGLKSFRLCLLLLQQQR
jgi:hypothetical protein